MAERKPTTAAGYGREETAQVEAAALTVATILGDLIDDLCIVGGLVPSMLIDRERQGSGEESQPGHCAFTVLKAHAFRRRGLGKDAYDLVYVLRHWPAGADDVASRLADHLGRERETVEAALDILREDFASLEHLGPRRAARFETGEDDDDSAADARGAVDDLLRALDLTLVS